MGQTIIFLPTRKLSGTIFLAESLVVGPAAVLGSTNSSQCLGLGAPGDLTLPAAGWAATTPAKFPSFHRAIADRDDDDVHHHDHHPRRAAHSTRSTALETPRKMKPTQILQALRYRRLRLTTKDVNKGFYKGTRTGSMGRHTKYGGYVIEWDKVRTYVCPPLKGFKVRRCPRRGRWPRVVRMVLTIPPCSSPRS